MPQFDKFTFFHQIFLLLFVFPLFYLLILQNFLPKLSSVLKVRQKFLNRLMVNVSHILEEQNQIQTSFLRVCSSLLGSKNRHLFASYILSFSIDLNNLLRIIPNETLKISLQNLEKQIYTQSYLFSYIMSLKNDPYIESIL